MPTTQVHGTSSKSNGFKQYTGPAVYAVWEEAVGVLGQAGCYPEEELSLEDIYKFLVRGTLQLFTYEEDGKILLCMLTELVEFPQIKTVRILALAGEGSVHLRGYWEQLANWARVNGCARVDVLVESPKLARLLKKYGGFKKKQDYMCADLRRTLQ